MSDQTTCTCCEQHRDAVTQAITILSGTGMATAREALVYALLTGEISSTADRQSAGRA